MDENGGKPNHPTLNHVSLETIWNAWFGGSIFCENHRLWPWLLNLFLWWSQMTLINFADVYCDVRRIGWRDILQENLWLHNRVVNATPSQVNPSIYIEDADEDKILMMIIADLPCLRSMSGPLMANGYDLPLPQFQIRIVRGFSQNAVTTWQIQRSGKTYRTWFFHVFFIQSFNNPEKTIVATDHFTRHDSHLFPFSSSPLSRHKIYWTRCNRPDADVHVTMGIRSRHRKSGKHWKSGGMI